MLFDKVSAYDGQLHLFKCQLVNGQRSYDTSYATADSIAPNIGINELDNSYFTQLASSVPYIMAGNIAGQGTNGDWYYLQSLNFFRDGQSQIKVYNGYGTPDPDYVTLQTLYDALGGTDTGGIMEGGWPMSSADMSSNLLLYVELSRIVNGRIVKTFKVFMKESYYNANIVNG